MEAENLSVTVGSTCNGEQEAKKKKFKKLRSIKLSKSPTLKPSTRFRPKSHFRNIVVDISSEAENSPYSSSSSQFSSLNFDAKTDISKVSPSILSFCFSTILCLNIKIFNYLVIYLSLLLLFFFFSFLSILCFRN